MAFGWYDLAWLQVKDVVIPSAQLGGSGTLSDFRWLVSRVDAQLQADARADGNDILFCDTDGVTKLDHELISYDNVTGTILALVRIPTVADASQDYTVWMYFDNAAAAAQENPDGVWKDAPSKPAVAAYHFENDVLDSSGNSFDLTNDGSVDVAGKVGRGRTLDGVADSMSATGADFSTVEQDTSFSILAFAKPGASAERQQIFYKGNTGEENLCLFINEVGHAVIMVYRATIFEYYAEGATNLKDVAWHRIIGVRDGTDFRIYVDGVDDTAVTSLGPTTQQTVEDVYIGKRFNEDYFLNADVDEIWVLSAAMNDAEAAADYNSLNDPAAFATFGPAKTFVESTGMEMPLTYLEEIEVDDEMVMSILEGTADRVMIVSIMEFLNSDQSMPFIQAPLVAVTSDEEMPVTYLEQLAVDEEMPITLLEYILNDLEMPVPILQYIYSDIEMVVAPSQDRDDDRIMPVTYLEGIRVDMDLPLTYLEEITVDPDLPVMNTQEIRADEEIPFHQLQEIYNDEEMPLNVSNTGTIADREMPVFFREEIDGDEEMPVSIEEHLEFDSEMPIMWTEALLNDEEIPETYLEEITVERELPMSWSAPLFNDVDIPVTFLEILYFDRELPISISEFIEVQRESQLPILQGVNADREMPATILQLVAFDLDVPIVILEHLWNELEMPVSFDKVVAPVPIVPADREMNIYIGQAIRGEREMPVTLRAFIEAFREMPMEWQDEILYVIPEGIYNLIVKTYQYDLEVMKETVLHERVDTELDIP